MVVGAFLHGGRVTVAVSCVVDLHRGQRFAPLHGVETGPDAHQLLHHHCPLGQVATASPEAEHGEDAKQAEKDQQRARQSGSAVGALLRTHVDPIRVHKSPANFLHCHPEISELVAHAAEVAFLDAILTKELLKPLVPETAFLQLVRGLLTGYQRRLRWTIRPLEDNGSKACHRLAAHIEGLLRRCSPAVAARHKVPEGPLPDIRHQEVKVGSNLHAPRPPDRERDDPGSAPFACTPIVPVADQLLGILAEVALGHEDGAVQDAHVPLHTGVGLKEEHVRDARDGRPVVLVIAMDVSLAPHDSDSCLPLGLKLLWESDRRLSALKLQLVINSCFIRLCNHDLDPSSFHFKQFAGAEC
mmetsp:Transcript_35314/g.83784  ORF Transcript_35314/g.83784 Transcript_35314/m.83784 type:complete len:357 (-) Transcript_35314:618-1688(-)